MKGYVFKIYMNIDFDNLLKEKNFVLRKSSSSKVYFRVYKDGVFQVLKFHNERRTYTPTINIGLFSLYGELMEQWFTVSGCIPRYEIVNLVVKRKTSSLKCANTIKSIPFVVPDNISISRQIEILCNDGISFLDAINDQPSLLQGIIRLEYRSLHYQWNDTLLFPAFLACGDWQRSDMVLSACIEQHSLDSGIDIDTVPQEDMDIYLSKYINVYRSWERKKLEEYDEFSKGYLKRYFSYLEHIRARDEEWRKTYLEENYARNMKICKRKHFVK